MGEQEVSGAEIDAQIKLLQAFVARNNKGKAAVKFSLNPDGERVRLLVKGVLFNEKNHGLKYCPCRMTTGEKAIDIRLTCPCNFYAQKTWREKGECWCSLFVKK